ncbi:hypothetical protein, partial [Streptomyces sp. NPDC000880]
RLVVDQLEQRVDGRLHIADQLVRAFLLGLGLKDRSRTRLQKHLVKERFVPAEVFGDALRGESVEGCWGRGA